MDIGLLVNLFDKVHEVDPGKEGARLKAGDIVDVTVWDPNNPDLEVNGVITLPSMPEQGWIVVSGVPGTDIDLIRNALVESGEVADAGNPIGKRRYRIQYPAAAWATFLAQRWVRVTWMQLKPRLKRVKTGGTITDGDLSRPAG